jgi:hypothetical protein
MGDRDRREDHGVKLAGDKVRTMKKEKKLEQKKLVAHRLEYLLS